jgi:hypothetical protein
MEISISKEILPSLEGYGFTETVLGDPKGSRRRYRNSTGLHVREYHDRFMVHEDNIDPRVDPIGHLVKDSPETLLALGTAFVFSRNRMSASTRPNGKGSFSPLIFFLSFVSIKKLLGVIKKFL